MSGKGNCYDNAMVETFFKTLKSELVWRTVFQTRAQARDAPLPATSTASTIPSGATRRSTSSAPSSSKGGPPTKPLSTEARQVHDEGAQVQNLTGGELARRSQSLSIKRMARGQPCSAAWCMRYSEM